MWFQLICYAINTRLDPISLGGGDDDWVNSLKHWKEYKHQYKFRYVPEKAKEDPDLEPQSLTSKNANSDCESDRPFDVARTFLRRLFVKP